MADMKIEDFSDPAEVRRLLEHIGETGAVGIPVDCGLLASRVLPVVTELVSRGFITFCSREAVAVDIYKLTDIGAAVCTTSGIAVSEPHEEVPESSVTVVEGNEATVAELANAILTVMRAHFQDTPRSLQSGVETANALGAVAGIVVASCAPHHEDVLKLFTALVRTQMERTLRASADGMFNTGGKAETVN